MMEMTTLPMRSAASGETSVIGCVSAAGSSPNLCSPTLKQSQRTDQRTKPAITARNRFIRELLCGGLLGDSEPTWVYVARTGRVRKLPDGTRTPHAEMRKR